MNFEIERIVVAVASGVAMFGCFRAWWAGLLAALLAYQFQDAALIVMATSILVFVVCEMMKRGRSQKDKTRLQR